MPKPSQPQPKPKPRKFISAQHAARSLGVSVNAVIQLGNDGKLEMRRELRGRPHPKGACVFSFESVEKYMAAHF